FSHRALYRRHIRRIWLLSNSSPSRIRNSLGYWRPKARSAHADPQGVPRYCSPGIDRGNADHFRVLSISTSVAEQSFPYRRALVRNCGECCPVPVFSVSRRPGDTGGTGRSNPRPPGPIAHSETVNWGVLVKLTIMGYPPIYGYNQK